MIFKRDTELAETAMEIARLIPEEQGKVIAALVRTYESATFADCADKTDFESKAIEDMLNDFNFDAKAVASHMAGAHPTLQQAFMRLCVAFVREMAEKKHFDARNKNSVTLAKALCRAADEVSVPLPVI